MLKSVQIVLQSFSSLYKDSENRVSLLELPQRILEGVILEARSIFMNEQTLLKLESPMYAVGDIHGNLDDLINIFHSIGLPANQKIIFLGDYVDRGKHSIEVITYLFALKCAFPDNIFLIRGNHEVRSINAKYGFKKEVSEHYDDDLWELYNQVFDYLPLAAIIDNKYFAVHGGISPKLKNVYYINSINRPFNCDNGEGRSDINKIVEDLLWSDPVTAISNYVQSIRGNGLFFGKAALMGFLSQNSLTSVIRAHQCVEKGYSQMWDGLLYTIFSSSNYSTGIPNLAGACHITKDEVFAFSVCKKQYSIPKLSKIPTIQRREVHRSRRNTFRPNSIGPNMTTSLLVLPKKTRSPSFQTSNA